MHYLERSSFFNNLKMTLTLSDDENSVPEWAKLGPDSICIIAPRLKPHSDQFIIQISGEGLWQWRRISTKLDCFHALNASLQPFGYAISQEAKWRISQCLLKAILSFKKRVCSPLLGKIDRHKLRNDKTYELEVFQSEFSVMPQDVIKILTEEREEMQKEIDDLNSKVEKQSRIVYSVLAEQIEIQRKIQTLHTLGNKGKKIQEVDERQARRKLSDIR